MCVRRDLEAFIAQDWSITARDFSTENFLGIDAGGFSEPEKWNPAFTTLESYRAEFQTQAKEFSRKKFAEDPRLAMYKALSISEPKIYSDKALIVKTFDGQLQLENGELEVLSWKSLFFLILSDNRWCFNGFVGYLPLNY